MSDLVLSGIISGCIGLVGVVTGSLITLRLEVGRERRLKLAEKQREVIQRLDEIQSDAASVLFVFRAIDDFNNADFSEPTIGMETLKAIAQIASLSLPSMNDCWKNLRKTIYMLFPQTLNSRYFQYFDSFLGDINKLNEVLIAKQEIESMQKHLTDSFRNDFAKAKYLLLLFNEELKATMSGKKNISRAESKAFKRQNKQQLKLR